MKTITQAHYVEPENTESIREEPLVIHRKEGKRNNQLIVFVHGLSGSRYGKDSTWGEFPAFIFADFPLLDVGLYEYQTLSARWRLRESLDLKKEAQVLADLIRDELSNYVSVILVGHSMGGLLCKAAISRLVVNNEKDILSRISGLILMATPQLGSMRVPNWLGKFSTDFQALKPHGEFISEINNTFENHLEFDERIAGVDRVTIPTWAVLGASDFWVDQMSAGIGLAARRKKIARGSHTEIVKPKDKDGGIYSWVRDRIEVCLSRFKYDVFIASAMAGLATEEDYRVNRNIILELQQQLRDTCNFQSTFYAGQALTSKAEFDAQDLSLEEDIRALSESRYFLLFYPQKLVSSVIFVAGLALALGKPSVYFVQDRRDLPFLMAHADQASLNARVKIYEYSAENEIFKLIRKHGARLWRAHRAP
jgi:pimeloyl-ACP methyl ester carboxylesterase